MKVPGIPSPTPTTASPYPGVSSVPATPNPIAISPTPSGMTTISSAARTPVTALRFDDDHDAISPIPIQDTSEPTAADEPTPVQSTPQSHEPGHEIIAQSDEEGENVTQ